MPEPNQIEKARCIDIPVCISVNKPPIRTPDAIPLRQRLHRYPSSSPVTRSNQVTLSYPVSEAILASNSIPPTFHHHQNGPQSLRHSRRQIRRLLQARQRNQRDLDRSPRTHLSSPVRRLRYGPGWMAGGGFPQDSLA